MAAEEPQQQPEPLGGDTDGNDEGGEGSGVASMSGGASCPVSMATPASGLELTVLWKAPPYVPPTPVPACIARRPPGTLLARPHGLLGNGFPPPTPLSGAGPCGPYFHGNGAPLSVYPPPPRTQAPKAGPARPPLPGEPL